MQISKREGSRGFPVHLWDEDAGVDPGETKVRIGRGGPARADGPGRTDGAGQRVSAPVASPPTSFAVLASSSAGNCSVLLHGEGRNRRVTLVDAGISPRRTRLFLEGLGLDLERIDEILFTHLDNDHCHPGWRKALPPHARFRIFRGHRGRAKRAGLLRRRTYIFDGEPFELRGGVGVRAEILDHDDLGVAAFRFDFAGSHAASASLGYATDLGRPTRGLVETLAGVDVLAIESNYCPSLQACSERPAFLKDRIMGGAGHLSNEECRAAVAAIAPRREVVLLHLSRECNRPELAARYHEGAPYAVTVASHDRPTDLIPLVP